MGLQQLSAALTSGNIVTVIERISLEPTGNLESLEDLQRTVIQLPGGALVYLENIVQMYRGYKYRTPDLAKANGHPAIAFAISMPEGGDILKLGKRLDSLMPEIGARYPWGIFIDKAWFRPIQAQPKVLLSSTRIPTTRSPCSYTQRVWYRL